MHQTRPNRLGIKGWFYGGRYGVERYLYALHRLTGLAILLYLVLHIIVVGQRAWGENAWKSIMAVVDQPVFHFLEYLLFIAVFYHMLNGLRLFFVEYGFLVGRPHQPVYPYRFSIHRQRVWAILVLIFALIFAVLGYLDFFVFTHGG